MADIPGRGARSTAFGNAAEEYDRSRLAPPQDAVRWLLAGGERRVVDLAAGTGQLSRLLSHEYGSVIAIEPDELMCAVLARGIPAAHVLAGVAESLPLRSGSVDAVLVGSAWHWFDADRASAEIARVLPDGGRLGAVATTPDHTVPWVGELFGTELDAHRTFIERSHIDVRLPSAAGFGAIAVAEFPSSTALPVENICAFFATLSNYIVASDAEKIRLERHVRAVLATQHISAGEVALPVRSWCWRTERTPRAIHR